jgi:HD-GYP domain-containing protein (c-di-GMP phosphodiesterase class II)
MLNENVINLGNLLLSFSDAVDLASPIIAFHQQRTAYIALCICRTAGLEEEEVRSVFTAALLHDIGAITVEEKSALHNFEETEFSLHEARGELLLQRCLFFKGISEIVGNHHKPWRELETRRSAFLGAASQIVQIADYVERLIDRNQYILHQAGTITEKINALSGDLFNPKITEHFNRAAKAESFWLDIASPRLYSLLLHHGPLRNEEIGFDSLETISKLFRDVIDFKSPYTATHTAGVSASAEIIAMLFGLPENEIRQIRVAANFHDLGKLIVPNRILEKPGKLDKDEFDVIKCHTYHSYHVVNSIKGLRQLAEWGAFHHEKLNGDGYPFRLAAKDLSLCSRIMMVADIFTALAEDRPYRKGMAKSEITRILQDLGEAQHLDVNVVNLVLKEFDRISDYVLNIEKLIKEFYDARFASVNQNNGVTDVSENTSLLPE